jgi:hypothetical protein
MRMPSNALHLVLKCGRTCSCEVGARLVALLKCDNHGDYRKHIVHSNNMNSGNDNCSSE